LSKLNWRKILLKNLLRKRRGR